eukprot:CAMPEP_0184483618 /NCGR_PEP_ID=MMETSP0113_2-20130426/5302_1 /TAXON_ID=91329 /ORGANISM="Norrisiella sphaerica, Strain BC52" /LENGTH=408 /DNA_ID=CAMNT_0026864155 /DNA_START=792 /DNA_END=2014 /DNA_ORIENTATION=+
MLIFHLLNKLKQSREERSGKPSRLEPQTQKKISRVQREIILFNLVATFLQFGNLTGDELDGNERACDESVDVTTVLANVSYWLLYRVLLAKMALLDQADTLLRFRKGMWFFLHMMLIPFTILLSVLPDDLHISFDGRLIELEGRTGLCAYFIEWFLLLTAASIDFVFSALFLLMFVRLVLRIPAIEENKEEFRRLVIRTSLYTLISVVSTAIFFAIFTFLVLRYEGATFSVVTLIASTDLFINTICMNLTWDGRFYHAIWSYYLGSSCSPFAYFVTRLERSGATNSVPKSSNNNYPAGFEMKSGLPRPDDDFDSGPGVDSRLSGINTANNLMVFEQSDYVPTMRAHGSYHSAGGAANNNHKKDANDFGIVQPRPSMPIVSAAGSVLQSSQKLHSVAPSPRVAKSITPR